MKPMLLPVLGALLLLCLIPVKAAEPRMVKDIHSGNIGMSSNPQNLYVTGSTLFFTATDATHGSELWKSDGSAAGTSMVKDIYPGIGASSYFDATIRTNDRISLGGIHFFPAEDGIHGNELWRTDGTSQGTFLLKDIKLGMNSSYPGFMVVAGGIFYFFADDGVHGRELWRSDGSAEGTRLVKDIGPVDPLGNQISKPSGLTAWGDKVYFAAGDGSGRGVWSSDGTADGTVMVLRTSLYPDSDYPIGFYPVGDCLFFVMFDAAHGAELWKTDGTTEGSGLVKDIAVGTESGYPQFMGVIGGDLYFSAYDGISTIGLWKSNGTTAGTHLVKTFLPGILFESVTIGSSIYFAFETSATGRELWKTDGTAAGTVIVKDIFPGKDSSGAGNLTAAGSLLYFTASDGTRGRELWRSNGTGSGTVMVKDIMTGQNSSYPQNLTVMGNILYFTASDATVGNEVWRTDGTDAGTRRVKQIRTGTSNSWPSLMTSAGNNLCFFTANHPTYGTELWKTDGTAAGTVIVRDLVPGTVGSQIFGPAWIGNTLYFQYQGELWKSNGTAAGTVLVKDILPGTENSNPRSFTAVNGQLYFLAFISDSHSQLWKSNGSTAGTVMVKDLNPGGYSVFGELAEMGGKLYFTDFSIDYKLWKSDGTTAGTQMIRNFTEDGSDPPQNLTAAGGRLFFQISSSYRRDGNELWMSDGTPDGTVMVKQTHAGPSGFQLGPMLAVGSRVFFTASGGPGLGYQLWVSDGTAEGTSMLFATDDYYGLNQLTAMGANRIFFTTNSSARGPQLWTSDGTAAGTVLVRQLHPPGGNSFEGEPLNLTVAGSTLYFTSYDVVHGMELWKSDGTAAGTVCCADLTGDSGSSNPSSLLMVGDTLFFSATTEDYGLELWALSTLVPDIGVSGNGARITPGANGVSLTDATDFGAIPVSTGMISRQFVVSNHGRTNLAISGVTLSGPHSRDFSVSSFPQSSLLAGSAGSLQISFNPSAPGRRQCEVHIASNDGEETPFSFTIAGTGLSVLEEWRQLHFGTTQNAGEAADSMDADGDGLGNLIEWGLGSEPRSGNTPALIPGMTQNGMEWVIPRNVKALEAGMVMTVEWSDSLQDGQWNTAGVTEQIMSDDGLVRMVKATIPMGTQRRFVRIQVQVSP